MSSTDRGSLTPLPEAHRRGLIVLTFFSILSFVSTSLLWSFLTYKFISYGAHKSSMRRDERRKKAKGREGVRKVAPQERPDDCEIDFSTGLREDLFRGGIPADITTMLNDMDRMAEEANKAETASLPHSIVQSQPPSTQTDSRVSNHEDHSTFRQRCLEKVNPFPIMVYNLLLADMMEALAFALSLTWLEHDGIHAPSATCWAQGWLGSISNLASSSFLLAISTTSFLTIVLGYRLPRWGLHAYVGLIWTFVFVINAAGVLFAEGGDSRTDSGESYFMRANVWCWISAEYSGWRLWSHYFWVIFAVILSMSLYVVIFCVLFTQKRSFRHLPRKRVYTPYTARLDPEAPVPSGYHPAFLLYPFVYLLCITPLVIGRIASLMGKDLGIPFFAFAGSLLAANGLFNSILWTTTILFFGPDDMIHTGLAKFPFVRTPARDYGHTVIISGPSSRGYNAADGKAERKEWWWWRLGGMSYAKAHERLNPDLVSAPTTPPVEGPYIKMEVVTCVEIEKTEAISLTL